MMRWMALAQTWLAEGSSAERLCLTLAHSLWQFGLLALLAWCVNAAGRRLSHAARYNLCLLLLAGGLAAVPITWASLAGDAATEPRAPLAMKPDLGSPLPEPAASLPGAGIEQPDVARSFAEAPEQSVTSPVATASEATRPNAALAAASRWIAALYAAGVSVMIVRLLRGIWRNHRLAGRSQSLAGHALEATAASLAARWKLRIRPRLVMASEVAMPCVMGLLRPTIVFPLAALGSLSPAELEMILAHELAHVRRGDLWVHLAQRLAEAVLFFNPGVWYLSRRISLLREYCCDELACERAPQRDITDDTQAARLGYARALVRLAELQFAQTHRQGLAQIASLAAAGDSPSQLRRRIAVLLGEPVRQPLRISRAGAMSFVVAIAALFVLPAVVASSDQPGESERPTATPGFPVDAAPSVAEPGFPRQASDDDAAPVNDRFVKKLPSGVEVKLLAIGTRGEPGKRWWRPDGVPIAGKPYSVQDFNQFAPLWPQAREIVFTIEGLPEGAGWRARLRPQRFYYLGSGGVVDAKGNSLPNHKAHFASLPAGAKTLNVEVGVAAGEWQTIASHKLRDVPSQPAGEIAFSGPLVFSGPSDVERASIEITHAVEEQVRLVAIDKDGSRKPAVEFSLTSTQGKFVSSFALGSKHDEIERVEFQSRPYTWITFDDLPAQPTTESREDDRPPVKVLAIGYGENVKQSGPRWWNMDGTPREAPHSQFQGRRNPLLMTSHRARQIVFELPNYTRGAAVRYEIKSKSGWSRGELTNSERELASGQPLRMHEVHTISYDDDVMTLRVGRADGEWKSVYQGQAGAVAQGNRELKGVVFSGAFLQDGATAVAVSHNWHGQSARLVAIDKAGQKHTGKVSAQLTAVETVNQTIFTFEELKPDDIRDFDFQVQDFTWTEIDVPVHPKTTISGAIKQPDGTPSTTEGSIYYYGRNDRRKAVDWFAGKYGGEYRIAIPAQITEAFWVAHHAPDLALAVVGPYHLAPGQDWTGADLTLAPGYSIKLQVQDEQGKGIPNAHISLQPYIGDLAREPVTKLVTDAEGYLTIDRLREKIHYQLTLEADGYHAKKELVIKPHDAPYVGTLQFKLEKKAD